VRLNSGGPTMMVVRLQGEAAIVAWRDRFGMVYEYGFPAACIRRVSPASAGSAEPTGTDRV
jgi:hypothetical protein